MIEQGGVHDRPCRQAEAVEFGEASPDADPIAVLAPTVVEDVDTLAGRGELRAKTFAEREVLDVEAEVNREAGAVRPPVSRTVDDGRIPESAMRMRRTERMCRASRRFRNRRRRFILGQCSGHRGCLRTASARKNCRQDMFGIACKLYTRFVDKREESPHRRVPAAARASVACGLQSEDIVACVRVHGDRPHFVFRLPIEPRGVPAMVIHRRRIVGSLLAAATCVVSGMPIAVLAADPIKFGLVTALSGQSARAGEAITRGMTIAIDEINAKGGIMGRPVELVRRDDEANPGEGRHRRSRTDLQGKSCRALRRPRHAGFDGDRAYRRTRRRSRSWARGPRERRLRRMARTRTSCFGSRRSTRSSTRRCSSTP